MAKVIKIGIVPYKGGKINTVNSIEVIKGKGIVGDRTFKENNLAAPRLAGQKESYLIATMTAFKKRTRLNAPDKSSLFETISEEQIKALSGYIANK